MLTKTISVLPCASLHLFHTHTCWQAWLVGKYLKDTYESNRHGGTFPIFASSMANCRQVMRECTSMGLHPICNCWYIGSLNIRPIVFNEIQCLCWHLLNICSNRSNERPFLWCDSSSRRVLGAVTSRGVLSPGCHSRRC